MLELLRAVATGLAMLLPIANPLTTVALLLALSTGMSARERKRQALLACCYVFAIMCVAYYAGQAVMEVFGISIPALRMAGGLIVAFIGYRIAFAVNKPLLDAQLHLPAKTRIDRPLILGSAIFGVGWGLAGFCPGPAIASLSLGLLPAVIFAVAMVIGMVTHDRFLAGKG